MLLSIGEHTSAHHNRPGTLECFAHNFSVTTRLATSEAVGRSPACESVDSFMQPSTANANGQFKAIVRPGAETIQRHGHIDSNFSHKTSSPSL